MTINGKWPARAFAVCAALGVAAASGSARADAAACTALNGHAYPATAMSLPSTGAKVLTATWVAEKPGFQAHCRLRGAITPVDPTAPPILFAINLPSQWNKKVLQVGGGGLNGVVVEITGPVRGTNPPDVAPPLAQGFVTVGTDSGHPASKPEIGVFFLNQEAVVNNAYGAQKKAHDLTMTVIAAYYGAKPAKVYFYGGSEGGRQAMAAVQKYPQDYDGVVAEVPALLATGNYVAKAHAYYATLEDGWMSAAQITALQAETAKQCDGLDGIKDGVISNYRACLAVFDFKPIRCPDGKAGGDTCLSDKQVEAVRTWRSPYDWGFPLKNGYTGIPGWSVGGEALPGAVNPWLQLDQRHTLKDPGGEMNGVQFLRYYVMGDGNFRGPVDLKDPKVRARIQEFSELSDQNNPDLSDFMKRGGKLIMKEHTADYAVGPEGVFGYYDSVVHKMGADKVAGFIRFYVNPGVSHGGSGTRADGLPIPDKVDLLGPLDRWVETGAAPDALTVTAYKDGKVVAAKPLCLFPTYPRYTGAGDVNASASYTCTAPQR